MTRTFWVTGAKSAKITTLLKSLANKGWAAAQNQTSSPVNGILWFGDSDTKLPESFNLSNGSSVILIVSMQNNDTDIQPFSLDVSFSTIKLQVQKMALKLAPNLRFNAIIYRGKPETILDGVTYLLDAKSVTGQMMYLDGEL